MAQPKTILAAALGLSLWAGYATAQGGPPDLDVEQTCRSSGGVQVGLSEKESREGCLRSEREAQNELKKRWGDFSADAKTQCSKQSEAGGYPSYVETVTCLELATGSVPAQTGGNTGAMGGSAPAKGAATGGGSKLTAEPSAKQRTNPIDVLDHKP